MSTSNFLLDLLTKLSYLPNNSRAQFIKPLDPAHRVPLALADQTFSYITVIEPRSRNVNRTRPLKRRPNKVL